MSLNAIRMKSTAHLFGLNPSNCLPIIYSFRLLFDSFASNCNPAPFCFCLISSVSHRWINSSSFVRLTSILEHVCLQVAYSKLQPAFTCAVLWRIASRAWWICANSAPQYTLMRSCIRWFGMNATVRVTPGQWHDTATAFVTTPLLSPPPSPGPSSFPTLPYELRRGNRSRCE